MISLWSALLHALDEPAAIIDGAGKVLSANGAADEIISDPDRFEPAEWTIRPIDDGPSMFLSVRHGHSHEPRPEADPERYDVRDIVLRQFFGTDGLMFTVIDSHGNLVELNDALASALRVDRDDVIGTPFEDYVASYDETMATQLGDELDRAGAIDMVTQMRPVGPGEAGDDTESGTACVRHIHWSIERDDMTGYHFAVGRDITDEREMTQELRRLAYTDGLTGLANRAMLVKLLDEQLAEGHHPAILFCDLDRFKIVNDSLGHAAGDELLRLLGQRLETLGSAEVIPARIGGDEFVVMVRDADLDAALAVAELVRTAVGSGFVIDGRRVKIGVSVGIALSDGRTTDAKHLLGEADTAAYQAKEATPGGIVVHDDALQRRLDLRFEVEAGLASALAENRFVVHYQPVVRLPGQGTIAVEALVRWRDEQGRLRRPGEFVMIAQDAGLLDEIGDRVLQQATRDIAGLRQGGRDLRLAVNATAGQISDPSFPARVMAALADSGLGPDALTIEVTESAVVADQSRTVPIMERLRSEGVRIAIDDFGTGYSSLSYLQELPIDVVKIDRSFVQRIDQDPVALSVVRAVVELCRALELDIVVEGIETMDQAALVEQLGCVDVQGYLFHPPLTFDQLSQQITGRRPSRVEDPAL